MANTFQLISSVTVGSGGAASIDFTSIPATFTDLCVKLSGRTTNSTTIDSITPKINGSSATFSQKWLFGNGSSASSNSAASYWGDTVGANWTSNTFSNQEIYIPNYAGSTAKSMSIDNVTENNGTSSYQEFIAVLWNNTAAITSIGFVANFAQYSTAYLYGIKSS